VNFTPRYVLRIDDDAPVPMKGLIVGHLGEGRFVVAWGDQQWANLPRVHVEHADTLVPAPRPPR
jgi:hypothetical protein